MTHIRHKSVTFSPGHRLKSSFSPSSSYSSSSSIVALLVFILAITHFPTPTTAMIDADQTASCSSDDSFFTIWNFNFASGGYYSLKIDLLPGDWIKQNQTVQIILSTDAQLDPVRSASMFDVCQHIPFNYSPTLWQTRLGADHGTSGSVTINDIPASDWVRLLILNCDGGEFQLTFSDVAINPGGEYLSLSEVPYKKLYLAFLWIWSILFMGWGLHLFAYRHWNIALQSVMILLPLTKISLCVPTLLYWRSASEFGRYPADLGRIRTGVEIIDQVAWFDFLLLLATGWRILTAELQPRERKMLLLMTVSLAFSNTVYTLYGGFFIFLMLIVYVLSLRLIFSSIVENGNILIRQTQILSRYDIDHTLTPLNAKLRQYRYLQVYIVAFVSVDVIFHLWAAIFLKNQPWIADMMSHAVSVLLCLCLGITFGMRPFNPFYLQIISLMLSVPSLSPPDPEVAQLMPIEEMYHSSESDDSNHSHRRVDLTAPSGEVGDGYHRLSDEASTRSTHLLPNDLLWSPGRDIPELPPTGASSWNDDGNQRADQPILIIDAPLNLTCSLMVGQIARPEEEVAAEFVAIPKSAYPYLPSYMRLAMRGGQHQQDERDHSRQESYARSRLQRENVERDI